MSPVPIGPLVLDMAGLHGGPDALGVPRFDFSTNANACGPAPVVLQTLQRADGSRYPDPAYTALREALAALHGVSPQRLVLAASASEFILRLSTAVALSSPAPPRVWAPQPGYGDYRRIADALGLPAAAAPAEAGLLWHTEPGSPLGMAERVPPHAPGAVVVVDRAYAPLRLDGPTPGLPSDAWQLFSPNKALGLAGVRGAYAIAPRAAAADGLLARLQALAPSWPLGAHAVAMLGAWAEPATQAWLQHSLDSLRDWKRQQLALLAELGWQLQPSVVPFFVARWPQTAPAPEQVLPRLRAHGIKLRDTSTMGLPGWLRLSVQPPLAQQALAKAWNEIMQ